MSELFTGITEGKVHVHFLADADQGFDAVAFHAHADHDQPRARCGVLDHLLNQPGNTHAFEHHARLGLRPQAQQRHRAIDVVTFGRSHLQPGLVRRLLGRVDHDIGPHFLCQGTSPGGKVRGHYRADPTGFQHCDQRQANWPASDHHRHFAAIQARTVHRVCGHGQGFGQRRDIRRQIPRHRHQHLFGQHHLLAVTARVTIGETDVVEVLRRDHERQ
ncbi:hypothetical protein D3C81_1545910 [compost metagenome]